MISNHANLVEKLGGVNLYFMTLKDKLYVLRAGRVFLTHPVLLFFL